MRSDEPVFLKMANNTTLPSFFPRWHQFDVHQDDLPNGGRNITFQMTGMLKDRADTLMFMLYCPDGTQCVDAWDSDARVSYTRTAFSDSTVAVRVAGLERTFHITFQVYIPAKIPVDIVYVLSRKMPQRSSFMREYRANVQHSARASPFGGTLFVQSATF
jgi:hypothetical protein